MTQRDDVFGDNLEPDAAAAAEPVEDVTETPQNQEVDNSPSGMRERLKDQASEIRALREKYEGDIGTLKADAMGKAFEAINLDPDEGMGKAVAITFEGEPEQLAQYAEETFGYVPEREHPFARQIARGQAALDQVGQTAGSIAPPTQQDELSKAEAEGDYVAAMRIKGAQLERLIRP